MVDLRQLSHEHFIHHVSSRSDTASAPENRASAVRSTSRYLSEPTAVPFRVEVYKRTRRAARPLAPTGTDPGAAVTASLDMTYADFITSAQIDPGTAMAQTA